MATGSIQRAAVLATEITGVKMIVRRVNRDYHRFSSDTCDKVGLAVLVVDPEIRARRSCAIGGARRGSRIAFSNSAVHREQGSLLR